MHPLRFSYFHQPWDEQGVAGTTVNPADLYDPNHVPAGVPQGFFEPHLYQTINQIENPNTLAGAGYLPGRPNHSRSNMAENELSTSERSALTAMNSNATRDAEAEAGAAEPVATGVIMDNLPDQNSNNEPASVGRNMNTIDDTQQIPPAGGNIPPQEDAVMGGFEVPLMNTGDGPLEGIALPAQLQSDLAAPAIPEPDMSQFKAAIDAYSTHPAALAQMVQNGAYMPDLIENIGFPRPKDIQSSLPTGIPLDGVTLADNWHSNMGGMLPVQDPTLYENNLQYNDYYDPAYDQQVVPDVQAEGFAKIDFDDAPFYVNSYSVLLGRDSRAQKAQMKDELGPPRNSTFRPPRSMMSERGGFVRHIEDESDEGHVRKRRRKDRSSNRPRNSRSSGSSSHNRSRRPSMAAPMDPPEHEHSDDERPAAVDIQRHLPDPHKLVTLFIHPPAPANLSDWKAISRKHLLIAYNFEKSLWEGHVLGKNGVFVEEEIKKQGDVFELTNGCHFQIGSVECLFRLPEHVPLGKTGAEEIEASGDEAVSTAAGLNDSDERLNYVMAGKEMSLDFRNERRANMGLDDESDSDDYGDEVIEHDEDASDGEDDGGVGIDQPQYDSDDLDSDDREELEEEEDEEDRMEDGEEFDFERLRPEPEPISQPQTPQSPQISQPKKRPVGRPPKNGISKRQQREEKAARLAQEASAKGSKKNPKKDDKVPKIPKKAKEPKETKEPTEVVESKEVEPAQQSIETEDGAGVQEAGSSGNKNGPDEKRKVGRPRKHPRPETPEQPREKRKYTKRKPKEPKDGETKADGEAGDDPDKDSKEQKAPRSPRSPTPEWDITTLTPEQYSKPPQNYVHLLYEVLSESPHKQMSLPQIYRALQRKYAYFVHGVTSVGWQSSVRHNLGQNEGFEKVERDGKGWKWAIKEGATFEKEKKKKPSPPPQYPPGHVQPIYPGYPPGYQGYPPQQGYPPPGSQGYPPQGMMVPPMGYQMHHQMPPNYHPGQQQSPYLGRQQPMSGLYQPGYQPTMHSQPPLTIPPALAPPVNTSYSSPYGPKPAASSAPPPTTQSGSSVSQPTTSTTQQSPPASQPPAIQVPPSPVPPASSLGQPGSSTAQPESNPSQGAQTTQLGGQTAQSGTSIPQSAPASQQGPFTGQTGFSNSQAGMATSQLSQASGLPSTPAVSQTPYQYPRQPQYTQYGQSPYFATSFPPQQTPPASQPYKPQPQPQQAVPPPSKPQDVQPSSMNTNPAPVSEKLLSAVESFKKILATQMQTKPHGLDTLENAVRKVLGQTSLDTPGYPDEASIVEVLQNMLKKIGLLPQGGTSNPQSGQASPSIPPKSTPQPQSYQPTNHGGTQASASQPHPPAKSTGSDKSSPAIMRPMFTQNQNHRSNSGSVPRPPINNMGRSNSNSSSVPMRQQTPVGSPAPPAFPSNGASTPVPNNEIGQVEEPKKEIIEPVLVNSEQTAEQSLVSQAAETTLPGGA